MAGIFESIKDWASSQWAQVTGKSQVREQEPLRVPSPIDNSAEMRAQLFARLEAHARRRREERANAQKEPSIATEPRGADKDRYVKAEREVLVHRTTRNDRTEPNADLGQGARDKARAVSTPAATSSQPAPTMRVQQPAKAIGQ